jgi:hypothetical protein
MSNESLCLGGGERDKEIYEEAGQWIDKSQLTPVMCDPQVVRRSLH